MHVHKLASCHFQTQHAAIFGQNWCDFCLISFKFKQKNKNKKNPQQSNLYLKNIHIVYNKLLKLFIRLKKKSEEKKWKGQSWNLLPFQCSNCMRALGQTWKCQSRKHIKNALFLVQNKRSENTISWKYRCKQIISKPIIMTADWDFELFIIQTQGYHLQKGKKKDGYPPAFRFAEVIWSFKIAFLQVNHFTILGMHTVCFGANVSL